MFYQCILLLLVLLAGPAIGQVQRHNNKFFINFDRVHSNTKMIPDYVIEKHKNLSLRECVVKCYLNEDCQTINHNKDSLECEILNSTSLVTKNILERKSGWTFYEADPTTKNTGPICMSLSPCSDSHVCVDTPEGQLQFDTAEQPSLFKCKCVEGFDGTNCNNYIGNGRYQKTLAGSCHLLKMKYKDIPNGYYWLQKNNRVKRVFCNMHHDEGLGRSKKSAIASCKWLKEKKLDSITDFYWAVDNDTEIVFKRLCAFLIHPEVVGRWSTIYGYKLFGEFALLEDGTLKNKTESMTLKPSKEKKIFPYSQGWMMSDHGSPSISDYFRYSPDDDTLEHFYFEKGADGTTSYKGLKNFVTSGKSTRKCMAIVGRWLTVFQAYSILDILIFGNRTIQIGSGTSNLLPSDEELVFPPTQDWMMLDHGSPSISDYFRYKPDDDILEHFYFDKGARDTTSYKGLKNFVTSGKSMRKSMIGRWKAIYSAYSDNIYELTIYEDGRIRLYNYHFSQVIPSNEIKVFPPTNGWMMFYYNVKGESDYFRYKPEDDTLEHIYFNQRTSQQNEYKGIYGYKSKAKSTRKTMVGKWKITYSNGYVGSLEIHDTDQVKTLRGTYNLRPSDIEQVFPSSQGWILFHRSPSSYEYFRYEFKDDTLKNFFFNRKGTGRTKYNGLSDFVASGISERS